MPHDPGTSSDRNKQCETADETGHDDLDVLRLIDGPGKACTDRDGAGTDDERGSVDVQVPSSRSVDLGGNGLRLGLAAEMRQSVPHFAELPADQRSEVHFAGDVVRPLLLYSDQCLQSVRRRFSRIEECGERRDRGPADCSDRGEEVLRLSLPQKG